MRYRVVFEHGPTSIGACVPDLPGCVAVGEFEGEALELIREAIDMQRKALQDRGR
jgi:predicted RNase H-like HicB family nuclease